MDATTPPARSAPILLALLAALALVALALGRGLGTLLHGLENATLAAVHAGTTVDEARLRGAVSGLERSLSWDEDPRTHFDLAILHNALAAQAEASRKHRLQALGHLEAGLGLAPLSAPQWSQLAFLRLQSDDDLRPARQALAMGTRLAMVDPNHLFPRLRGWMILFPPLDEEERALFSHQLALAFAADPGRLGLLALAHNVPAREWLLAAGVEEERLDRVFYRPPADLPP